MQKKYRVFDPADFGLYGRPAEDESYALLEELDGSGQPVGTAYLTYIGNEEFTDPPTVDFCNFEPFEFHSEGKAPVFDEITVFDTGRVILGMSGNPITLSAKQNELLGTPYCIQTCSSRYNTEFNDGGVTEFKKDLTLEGIQPVKLNGKYCIEAMKEKYPALLETTHVRYGNTPPFYPFAKYYESKDKTIVFVARSQIPELSDSLLNGDIPYYYDFFTDVKWDNSNIYGICVVDDSREDKYSIRLVRADVVKEMKKEIIKEKKEKIER